MLLGGSVARITFNSLGLDFFLSPLKSEKPLEGRNRKVCTDACEERDEDSRQTQNVCS